MRPGAIAWSNSRTFQATPAPFDRDCDGVRDPRAAVEHGAPAKALVPRHPAGPGRKVGPAAVAPDGDLPVHSLPCTGGARRNQVACAVARGRGRHRKRRRYTRICAAASSRASASLTVTCFCACAGMTSGRLKLGCLSHRIRSSQKAPGRSAPTTAQPRRRADRSRIVGGLIGGRVEEPGHADGRLPDALGRREPRAGDRPPAPPRAARRCPASCRRRSGSAVSRQSSIAVGEPRRAPQMRRAVRPKSDAGERLDPVHVAGIVVGPPRRPDPVVPLQPARARRQVHLPDRRVQQHELAFPPATAPASTPSVPACPRSSPLSRYSRGATSSAVWNCMTSQSPASPRAQRRDVRAVQHLCSRSGSAGCRRPGEPGQRSASRARPSPAGSGSSSAPTVAGRLHLSIEAIAEVVARRIDRDRPEPGPLGDRHVRRDRVLVARKQRQIEKLHVDRRRRRQCRRPAAPRDLRHRRVIDPGLDPHRGDRPQPRLLDPVDPEQPACRVRLQRTRSPAVIAQPPTAARRRRGRRARSAPRSATARRSPSPPPRRARSARDICALRGSAASGASASAAPGW